MRMELTTYLSYVLVKVHGVPMFGLAFRVAKREEGVTGATVL